MPVQAAIWGRRLIRDSSMQFVDTKSITPLPVNAPVSTLVLLLSDWRDFLLGKRSNPIPGEEGLSAVKVCDACRQSAIEDGWVAIQN